MGLICSRIPYDLFIELPQLNAICHEKMTPPYYGTFNRYGADLSLCFLTMLNAKVGCNNHHFFQSHICHYHYFASQFFHIHFCITYIKNTKKFAFFKSLLYYKLKQLPMIDIHLKTVNIGKLQNLLRTIKLYYFIPLLVSNDDLK